MCERAQSSRGQVWFCYCGGHHTRAAFCRGWGGRRCSQLWVAFVLILVSGSLTLMCCEVPSAPPSQHGCHPRRSVRHPAATPVSPTQRGPQPCLGPHCAEALKGSTWPSQGLSPLWGHGPPFPHVPGWKWPLRKSHLVLLLFPASWPDACEHSDMCHHQRQEPWGHGPSTLRTLSSER